MHAQDTIVALATAAGPAARLIVRTSGPAAFEMAASVGAEGLAAGDTTAVRLAFADLTVTARCLAFRGPRSHTGENVVEYHLPGNPLLGRLLIEALVQHGARQAEPGEFSARAFFNGKLRLDEAEGVSAVIGATNERELSAARKLRAGELARRLEPSLKELADLLALCELGIDFSEEDVVILDSADARRRIGKLHGQLGRLLAESPRLEQLGQPPRIALVGWPNAGKSTLLNTLVGYRRAVASEQAGTTRDALAVDVELPGGRVTLLDLAGLGGDDETGILDAEARCRATQEAATADLLVLIYDVTDERPDPPLPRPPDLRVHAKLDLLPQDDRSLPDVAVSALTGSGLEALRHHLSDAAFSAPGGAESLALSTRHREQIAAALAALDAATAAVDTAAGAEVLALYLREALDALGAILGVVSPDDLLGRIFGRFCIGK